MEHLPKIVRDRLQVSGSEGHPEADLLAAFAEHSLTRLEREQIAEHLSRCAECREVIALAMPEAEAILQPQPTTSADRAWTSWFRWPVLRWGTLAACVTVVAAAVLLRYPKQSQIAFEGKIQQTQAQGARSAPGKQPTPSVEAGSESSPERDVAKTQGGPQNNAVAKKNDKPLREEAPSLKGTENRPAVAAEESAAKDMQNATSGAASVPIPEAGAKQAFAAPPAPAPLPSTAEPSSQSGDRNKLAPQTMDQAVEVREAPSANTELRGRLNELKKKQEANVSARAQAAASAPASRAEIAAARKSANDLNAAEWSLSDTGVPQRSFDHGQSWQKIDVGNHAGFRALSATNADIWVGGVRGLLYHSRDGGSHWTQVIPNASGINLASDINHIEFADSQHGRVTTVNGETWITTDGGSNWAKE